MNHFGEPSEPPELYWQGWMGHVFHLSPSDIGDLTPQKLEGIWEQVHNRPQGPRGR